MPAKLDGKTGDVLMSFTEAIKEGTDKFTDPREAYEYMIDNNIYPDFYDGDKAYFKAHRLGVMLTDDHGKSRQVSKNDKKDDDK